MQELDNIEITFGELFEFLGVNQTNEVQRVSCDLFVETPSSELVPILGVIQKTNHNIFKYVLENGIEFLVSDKHLVFEFGTLKNIKDCEYVDLVGSSSKIKHSEFIQSGDVFDVSIPAPHLYVTPNGVIHHNTTLCLQTLELLETAGKKTAYISGEETQEQLAFTSKRIGVSKVPLANMTDVNDICEAIVENKFDFVVIDSLPTLTVRERMSSREKEEYITTKLIQTAKENEICIGVILHFTKTGNYKGGTLYPHSCDSNLIMTRNVDDESLRDIESTKNRFGSTGVMVVEMSATGFTFEPVKISEPTIVNNSEKKASKRDSVLEVLTDEEKTVAVIARESQVNGQYLVSILRDLCNEGLVVKNGRGSEATYKQIDN